MTHEDFGITLVLTAIVLCSLGTWVQTMFALDRITQQLNRIERKMDEKP